MYKSLERECNVQDILTAQVFASTLFTLHNTNYMKPSLSLGLLHTEQTLAVDELMKTRQELDQFNLFLSVNVTSL